MMQRFSTTIPILFCVVFSGCGLLITDTYKTERYQAVHEATLNGERAQMDAMLNANPRLIRVPDYDRNTLLHLAVLRNNVAEVQDLLTRHAPVNAINHAGMTPMHIAAKQGETEIAALLLSHHPNPHLKDRRDWTALVWAEKSHHESVAKMIRAAAESDHDLLP